LRFPRTHFSPESFSMTQQLQQIIDAAWEDRANISISAAPAEVRDAVEHVITELNNGKLRVATRESVGKWTVHQWIKKAVLLSFRLKDNEQMQAGSLGFYDKVPTKFSHLSAAELKESGVRIVPPAVARRGSFIAKGAILMPSYVNIGAYVGEGTMVDTWATVGSCAQVGKPTCTCRAAWAWAACSSRCRPTRPSSRTTASSARAPKWSKA
jgi:2,3,4,5-tetrahydropyridine-2-carboxylate N-succinyltransferase